ncbi:unnamed protein product [Lathyrus oleraceus]|uniref:PetM of cytochrome b6/f complex subunit 7 n=1 Tax=Pisum sativum TaxID=3888 RepID=A0A9D4W7G1_PEA|nr:cytochrome b6-f complex subunit 7, chloroplastic-like [Pisum sativum]KAI5397050.1 hypothetical protein KIW84_063028 [Pisum sativum]
MASASAASPSTITVVGSSVTGSKSRNNRKGHNVKFITALNSFNGLQAQHSTVASLGVPVSSDLAFAKVRSSIYNGGRRSGRGGGALASKCNAAGEIFQIAAIMNGLTLVGVAVGFVLLRIEAAVEEAE